MNKTIWYRISGEKVKAEFFTYHQSLCFHFFFPPSISRETRGEWSTCEWWSGEVQPLGDGFFI